MKALAAEVAKLRTENEILRADLNEANREIERLSDKLDHQYKMHLGRVGEGQSPNLSDDDDYR